jgi:hypothetical protein
MKDQIPGGIAVLVTYLLMIIFVILLPMLPMKGLKKRRTPKSVERQEKGDYES